MTPPHTRRARRTTALAAFAAVALAVPAVAACDKDDVDRAIDCARFAVDLSRDVDDLQDTVTDGAIDGADADTILDRLDKDVDRLQRRTDGADVDSAAKHLREATDNVRTSVDQGKDPDLGPVNDALDDITKVCAPG